MKEFLWDNMDPDRPFQVIRDNFHPLHNRAAPQYVLSRDEEDFHGGRPEGRRDALIIEKELRRYVAKQPVAPPHTDNHVFADRDRAEEEREFMALLSEHWTSRMDANTLSIEFKVRQEIMRCARL